MGNCSTSYRYVYKPSPVVKLYKQSTTNSIQQTIQTDKNEEKNVEVKEAATNTPPLSEREHINPLKEILPKSDKPIYLPHDESFVDNELIQTDNYKHPCYIEEHEQTPYLREPKHKDSMPIVFDYKRTFCKIYEPFTKSRLGALGEVEQCRHRDTNELYTVKAITRYRNVKNRRNHPDYIFMQDIEHLLEIKNENILAVKDVLHDKKEDSVYIVFEYVSGTVVKYDNGRIVVMSEDEARTIFRQLLRGLDHLLLQYRTIHGSIAPENLLLGINGELKISGFSIKKSKIPKPPKPTSKMNKFEYSKANDIWSCGMCLHLIIFGTLPPPGNVLAYVNNSKKISNELKSLFSRMLDEDPSTRISLNELLYDPWVTNNDTLKPVETYIPRIQVEYCD